MELLFNNLDKLLDAPNGIEKARQLILQLAVQGKLTEQDPNDEPASELLKKIKKEKEKLIAEGKIKKQRELPQIKDEEKPFELPKGWVFTHLENLSATIHYGYTASANDSKTDVRLVRITDIQNDKVNWNTVPGCQIDDKNYNTYALNNGDLLIARTGGTIGKTYLVENIAVKAVFASYLIRIIPLRNINQYYLKLFTGSQLYWSQLYQKSMGTGQPNVNGTSLKELIISIPPLNEQKRIVEKVNSLMTLLNELEEKRERRNQKRIKLNNSSLDKLLTSKNDKELKTNWKQIEENFSTLYSVPENVAKLKQAILQLAVKGKLTEQWRKENPDVEPADEHLIKIIEGRKKQYRIACEETKKNGLRKPRNPKNLTYWKEKGETIIVDDDIPKNWVKTNFINLCVLQRGHDLPKSKMETGKYPVVSSGGVLGYHSEYRQKGPGVYTGRSGSVGKVHYIKDDYWPHNTTLFVKDFHEHYEWYVYYALKSFGVEEQSTSTAVPTLNRNRLFDLIIMIPPVSEQKRIVEKVNELMSLCNALEEKLKKKEEKGERLVGAVVNRISSN